MAKCPEALPAPAGKTGADLLTAMKWWGDQYHECAARHNGLVDALSN